MRVAVCEHGVGNVRSVVRAVERAATDANLRVDVLLTRDPDELRRADRVVVPGQGSFGAFATGMKSGLAEVLGERIRAGIPYLGICLGLQVLFEESDEAPGERGLGIFRGRVRRLEPGVDPASGAPLPLPHVGWNGVVAAHGSARNHPWLSERETHFYFAHSYAAVPEDANVTFATTQYGTRFASAVANDNVLGVQFHPEKSQREGLLLLRRFLSL